MAVNKLLEKIIKNSTIPEAAQLSVSKFFNEKDVVHTSIPALNIALSGTLEGGLVPGGTMFAGPSKHFKTLFSLVLAKAYMDKYPESIMIFYDSEFGTPKSYFTSLGIDMDRVLHCPLINIERLKVDIATQLEGIKRTDKVIIVIDSIGNVASKKEVDDALADKSTADMTRAKQLKSLFRIVTPHLNLKDIPLIVVNHTYKEQALFPKDIVSGGTGSYYGCDNIYIVGREQEKDSKDVVGFKYSLRVEKSRYVKEKSKIYITVRFDGGLDRYSGMLELATEAGFITQSGQGKKTVYNKVDPETGVVDPFEWKEEALNGALFWKSILEDQRFSDFVKDKYLLVSGGPLIAEEEVEHTKAAKKALS